MTLVSENKNYFSIFKAILAEVLSNRSEIVEIDEFAGLSLL